jgi:hypothetical protein
MTMTTAPTSQTMLFMLLSFYDQCVCSADQANPTRLRIAMMMTTAPTSQTILFIVP